ncbi:MAG: ABC transporter ATP-binding protein [Limnohabitans sp.]
MRGIDKRFGAVHANRGVDLSVRTAQLHAVVGENGAGKSTLMSLAYGLMRPDAGQIRLFGQTVELRHAHDAMAHGVGMVHQHFMQVGNLSVLDNVLLGAEPHAWLPRARRIARERLLDLMARTGLQVPLDRLVQDLNVGDGQRLEILKALFRGARLLILDEPTAVLTPQETEQLFEVLRRLRAQGQTTVIITHKLKEVMALCDQVTVMREGQVVMDAPVAQTTLAELAHAMVGRSLPVQDPTDSATVPGPVRLQVSDLRWRDPAGAERLGGIDLQVHAGEILGVAGVAGNGQSELLDALAGLIRPQTGQLQLGAQVFGPKHWLNPSLARQLGLAHVPEDRHARGLVMSFAAWESAVLGHDGLPAYCRAGWMRHRAMRAATRQMMAALDVRPADERWRCADFSGGNQQKLVLAREMGRSPQVLLVGQPTRGVDIGAIATIHARLRALRAAGCAILLVSSELDELLALSDRLLVMNQGRISACMARAQVDESRLGLLMADSAPQEGGT